MATKHFKKFLPPAVSLMLSAVPFFSPSAGAQNVRPLDPRQIVARGFLKGTRESLRIVTWQTANTSHGHTPYARAHLAIETPGTPSHVLYEIDGGDSQYRADS